MRSPPNVHAIYSNQTLKFCAFGKTWMYSVCLSLRSLGMGGSKVMKGTFAFWDPNFTRTFPRKKPYVHQTSPLHLLFFGDVLLLTKLPVLGASLNTIFSWGGRIVYVVYGSFGRSTNHHTVRTRVEYDPQVHYSPCASVRRHGC